MSDRGPQPPLPAALDAWVRLTLDSDRLAVLGQVATTPRTAAEVVAATGVAERRVLEALAAFVRAGVVRTAGPRYRLDQEALRALATDMRPASDIDPSVLHGMTDEERVVLTRFFTGSRLTQIPLARSKRRIVLERLSLDFEPGVVYPEATVNEILGARHPDYASLRRHLVDEGFLDRRDGRYWRTGGRVDTGPEPRP